MTDANPPLIFAGQYHSAALDAARTQFESGAFGVVVELLSATIHPLIKISETRSKCGADLMAFMGARAVFMALAKWAPEDGDIKAWLSITRSRALAALDVASVAALHGPRGSALAETHTDWMAACRIGRADDLFRADAKDARRSKIKLNKGAPRPAAEHQPAPKGYGSTGQGAVYEQRQHWEAS